MDPNRFKHIPGVGLVPAGPRAGFKEQKFKQDADGDGQSSRSMSIVRSEDWASDNEMTAQHEPSSSGSEEGEIRSGRPHTWSGYTTYDRDRSRSPSSSSRSLSTIPHNRDRRWSSTTGNESDTSYPTYRYSSYTPSMFSRSSEIIRPLRPTPVCSRAPSELPRQTRSSPPNSTPVSRPGSRSSSPTSSPPPYRPFPESKKPPQECKCPIGKCTCPLRHGEIDHRELVPLVQDPHTKGAHDSVTVRISVPTLSGNDVQCLQILKDLKDKHLVHLNQKPRNRDRERMLAGFNKWVQTVSALDFSMNPDIFDQSGVVDTLAQFLHDENAGTRHDTLLVPMYLEEDLTVLLLKWINGTFTNALNRGLLGTISASRRPVLKVNPNYQLFKSANYFGDGDLVNGQRWIQRVHMVRDGAHGELQAGIWGPSIAVGAQALVMGLHGQGGQYYADVDQGDQVRYIGTQITERAIRKQMDAAGFDGDLKPSRGTRMLFTSVETGWPVRLFRSSKFAHCSTYRPREGYRYDGLYWVQSTELLEDARQIWAFQLRRLPGQGAIRVNDQRTFQNMAETNRD